ncbi:MAG TPA: exonuclease domain-containing protein, partial [Flavobacteriaceae bacterium]|nr:exonuclease domain-containing protein [Flavobacteriaceae bacterium]
EEVIDEFTTLVNPQCNIPSFITNLTGITNAMVSHAPTFSEISEKILAITKGCIFVAHSVNFDYNIIKAECKRINVPFNRKKLCTVRLSRKLIPGLKSYSLGAICSSQHIVIKDRHRARGDAEATTVLFEKLMAKENAITVFNTFLNPRSKQATLPPMLSQKIIETLPTTPGVYYFKNESGKVIYVGKAKNIKQRVISHFYDKKKKEITMCLETANVTYTETGNELVALLLESAEIKKYFPKYNRSQRKTQNSIALFSYEDRNGILHLAQNSLKMVNNPLMTFSNISAYRTFVETLCEEFELCPKYCHLQSNVKTCSHFKIEKCKGVCKKQESVKNYNQRVKKAIASTKYLTTSFLIKEKGRSAAETAYVLVQNGVYKGYGFSSENITENNVEEIIQLQQDNNDVKRILKGYLKQHEDVAIPISYSTSTLENFVLA